MSPAQGAPARSEGCPVGLDRGVELQERQIPTVIDHYLDNTHLAVGYGHFDRTRINGDQLIFFNRDDVPRRQHDPGCYQKAAAKACA